MAEKTEWFVIESKAVIPRFDSLAKYINNMERQGWNLTFVDGGVLYFKKSSND